MRWVGEKGTGYGLKAREKVRCEAWQTHMQWKVNR
jgi:hypothetical protein